MASDWSISNFSQSTLTSFDCTLKSLFTLIVKSRLPVWNSPPPRKNTKSVTSCAISTQRGLRVKTIAKRLNLSNAKLWPGDDWSSSLAIISSTRMSLFGASTVKYCRWMWTHLSRFIYARVSCPSKCKVIRSFNRFIIIQSSLVRVYFKFDQSEAKLTFFCSIFTAFWLIKFKFSRL